MMKLNYAIILTILMLAVILTESYYLYDFYTYSCYSMQEAYTSKDYCYRRLAEGKSDPAVCDKIRQGSEIKDLCYEDVAKQRQDPTICDKSRLYKNRCYNDVAIARQDPAICDKIENDATSIHVMKDACRTAVINFKNQMEENRRINSAQVGKT